MIINLRAFILKFLRLQVRFKVMTTMRDFYTAYCTIKVHFWVACNNSDLSTLLLKLAYFVINEHFIRGSN